MSTTTQVTAIGIGNMGAALASALLNASIPLTIWNRTASRPQVQSLVARGAAFEPSLAAAVARSRTLLICLLDYAAVHAALDGLPHDNDGRSRDGGGEQPLAGKTVINLTNGTPGEARAMEARARALGAAAYFDGAVMVTPQMVGTPAASVVLAGETRERYEGDAAAAEGAGGLGVAAVLRPVGAVQYIAGGDAGAASLLDVAALAGMYGMFVGAMTGMALLRKQKQEQRQEQEQEQPEKGAGGAQAEGGDAKVKPAVDAVMVPMLSALVPYVSLLAERVDARDWMDDLGNPLAMQEAGVRNIIRACDEEGADGSGLKFLHELMQRAVQDGFGPGGLAAVAQYMWK